MAVQKGRFCPCLRLVNLLPLLEGLQAKRLFFLGLQALDFKSQSLGVYVLG